MKLNLKTTISISILLFSCLKWGQANKDTTVIGFDSFILIDSSRIDLLSPNKSAPRKLKIKAWYPAQTVTNPAITSYIPPLTIETYLNFLKLDSSLIDRFKGLKGKAFHKLPFKNEKKKLPIIIFSHGYHIPIELYTRYFEEWAASGYVVFAISHTYETSAVIFDDQEIAYFNQDYIDKQFDKKTQEKFSKLQAYISSTNDFEKEIDYIKKTFADFPGTKITKRWASDIRCLIQALQEKNSNYEDFFYNCLDLDKIGAIGHSFGGASVVQACIEELPIKAVINLDGWQFGEVVNHPLNTPFLEIISGDSLPDFNLNEVIYSQNAGPYYTIQLKNTRHSSFTDLPYFLNAKEYSDIGKIRPKSAFTWSNQLILEFFKAYLNNTPYIDSWPFQAKLADILRMTGNQEKAKEIYYKAITQHPNELSYRNWIIANYIIFKDYELAQMAIEDALKISPTNSSIINQQAWLSAKLGKLENSLKGYQQTNNIAGQGWVYALMGDREKALAIAANLTKELESTPWIAWDIAFIYLGLKDYNRTIDLLLLTHHGLERKSPKDLANWLWRLEIENDYDAIRSYPKFQQLFH